MTKDGGSKMKQVLLGVVAIIVCFAMVGCGEKEENVKSNDNSSTQSVENNTSEDNTNEESGETFKPVVLVSNDTKYVIKISESTEYTYFHEGDTITGFQVNMHYSTPAAAELAKKTLEEDQITNPTIDSIVIDGSNLVVRYKSSMYDGRDLNSIKMVYEYVGAVSK